MNKTPVSIMVLGILNIAFGLLGVAGGALTMLNFAMSQRPGVPNPMFDILRDHPWYATTLNVLLVLGMIVGLILVVAGVGLLRMMAWGRSLSIFYSAYCLVSAAVGAILNVWLIQQLMERAAANPGPAEQGALVGGVAGGVGGICCGLIYPLVLLYFMFRPEVVAALCAGPRGDTGHGPWADTGNPYQSP